MAKDSEPKLSCPPSGPVFWVATLKEGCSSTRTLKRSFKVQSRRWFDARDQAMRYFGVEASELDVVLKEPRT